jgi:hypothetical protein
MFLNPHLQQLQNPIGKPLKQGQNDTPKTYIYDQPLSWLGTGTSIKISIFLYYFISFSLF